MDDGGALVTKRDTKRDTEKDLERDTKKDTEGFRTRRGVWGCSTRWIRHLEKVEPS